MQNGGLQACISAVATDVVLWESGCDQVVFVDAAVTQGQPGHWVVKLDRPVKIKRGWKLKKEITPGMYIPMLQT